MVLIPNDIGVRMRLQAESALLQPTAPIQGIPSDLPELRQGQTFRAQIQESLPDNTYRALVAGKSLTLSLPEGAKAGDTLELVVIDRSNKAVVARLANTSPTVVWPTVYPYTELSPAAKLISSLLPEEGMAPPPAALTRGEPVLPTPPSNTAQLATALAGAVSKSGIFYESHQAEWIAGKLPLTQLLDEPQAQHSDFKTLISHLMQTSGTEQEVTAQTPLEKSVPVVRHASEGPAAKSPSDSAIPDKEAALDIATHQKTSPAINSSSIPEDVRPLIQQQLDALATNRLAWHGEVWPQQSMEWEIERDGARQGEESDSPDRWVTSLKLELPNFGDFAAKLYLTQKGISLALQVNSEKIQQINDALPQLEAALAAAGVPLLGSLVRPIELIAKDPESTTT